jgi:hypothetical protein
MMIHSKFLISLLPSRFPKQFVCFPFHTNPRDLSDCHVLALYRSLSTRCIACMNREGVDAPIWLFVKN